MERYKERGSENTFSGTGFHFTCEWWKIKDPADVANAFNNFFTITEKLCISTHRERDAISILKDLFPGNFPT